MKAKSDDGVLGGAVLVTFLADPSTLATLIVAWIVGFVVVGGTLAGFHFFVVPNPGNFLGVGLLFVSPTIVKWLAAALLGFSVATIALLFQRKALDERAESDMARGIAAMLPHLSPAVAILTAYHFVVPQFDTILKNNVCHLLFELVCLLLLVRQVGHSRAIKAYTEPAGSAGYILIAALAYLVIGFGAYPWWIEPWVETHPPIDLPSAMRTIAWGAIVILFPQLVLYCVQFNEVAQQTRGLRHNHNRVVSILPKLLTHVIGFVLGTIFLLSFALDRLDAVPAANPPPPPIDAPDAPAVNNLIEAEGGENGAQNQHGKTTKGVYILFGVVLVGVTIQAIKAHSDMNRAYRSL